MVTAVVLPAIMIHMEAHNAATLGHGFKIQAKAKNFFIFIKWKMQVCFSRVALPHITLAINAGI